MKIKSLSVILIATATLLSNVVVKAEICPNPKTITIKNCSPIEGDTEHKTCIFIAEGWEYPQTTEEKLISSTEQKLKNNLYTLNKVEITNTKKPSVRCSYVLTDSTDKNLAKNLIFLRKTGKFTPSATSEWDQSKPAKSTCYSNEINHCQFEPLKK